MGKRYSSYNDVDAYVSSRRYSMIGQAPMPNGMMAPVGIISLDYDLLVLTIVAAGHDRLWWLLIRRVICTVWTYNIACSLLCY